MTNLFLASFPKISYFLFIGFFFSVRLSALLECNLNEIELLLLSEQIEDFLSLLQNTNDLSKKLKEIEQKKGYLGRFFEHIFFRSNEERENLLLGITDLKKAILYNVRRLKDDISKIDGQKVFELQEKTIIALINNLNFVFSKSYCSFEEKKEIKEILFVLKTIFSEHMSFVKRIVKFGLF